MRKILFCAAAAGLVAAIFSVGGASGQRLAVIDVGNLPVDGNGDLRVAGVVVAAPAAIRFVGFTAATFSDSAGFLTISRACNAEFPSTRVCDVRELGESIPPPPDWTDRIRLAEGLSAGGASVFIGCYTSDGRPSPCRLEASDPGVFPAACCGL